MIITGFGLSSKGNATVRVSNDHQTASFTVITNKNLPFTHDKKHLPLWSLSDSDKHKIESEIRAYIAKSGDITQKAIVFGANPKVIYSSRNDNFNR